MRGRDGPPTVGLGVVFAAAEGSEVRCAGLAVRSVPPECVGVVEIHPSAGGAGVGKDRPDPAHRRRRRPYRPCRPRTHARRTAARVPDQALLPHHPGPVLDVDRVPAVTPTRSRSRSATPSGSATSLRSFPTPAPPVLGWISTTPTRSGGTARTARPARRTSDPSAAANTTPRPTVGGPSRPLTRASSSGDRRTDTGSSAPTRAPSHSDPGRRVAAKGPGRVIDHRV